MKFQMMTLALGTGSIWRVDFYLPCLEQTIPGEQCAHGLDAYLQGYIRDRGLTGIRTRIAFFFLVKKERKADSSNILYFDYQTQTFNILGRKISQAAQVPIHGFLFWSRIFSPISWILLGTKKGKGISVLPLYLKKKERKKRTTKWKVTKYIWSFRKILM